MLTKKNKIKLLLKSLFVQFGALTTDEGVQLLYDEDGELLVGYKVYVEQETESGETEYVPAPDGEYKSGDTVFVIADGECKEIRTAEPEAQAETSDENPDIAENLEDENPDENPDETETEETSEPGFDAEQAIADLRAEFDGKINALTEQVNELRAKVDELLALPQDEDAFSKESKNENGDKKSLFKTRK